MTPQFPVRQIYIGLLAIVSVATMTACTQQTATPVTNEKTTAYASSSTPSLTFEAADYQFLQPVLNQNEPLYLGVGEAAGVSLLNAQLQIISNLAIKAEHLDIRQSSQSGTIVATTVDINSGEVVLITLDIAQQRLEIANRIAPQTADIEAQCISTQGHDIWLFTIDARGLGQVRSIYQHQAQTWQTYPITQFSVGPQVKSCAVDDISNTLYIAEENIGVWQYAIDPETEAMRELIQLPDNMPVEYLDTTSTGTLMMVSPDFAGYFEYQATAQQITSVDVPTLVEPKTIQVSETSNVTVAMFDDATGHLQAVQHPTIKYDLSTAQQDKKIALKTSSFVAPHAHLHAFAQTAPVNRYGDAADDPAIWVNATNPSDSLIYTTDKKYGLNVYTLDGALMTTLPVGRINNIDIRYDVEVNGSVVDIAIASNRSNNSLTVFSIDRDTGFPSLSKQFQTDLTDVYGICLGRYQGALYGFINDTDGRFQQYKIDTNYGFSATMVDEWTVPSQPEGCVVDDKTGRLFYGEERAGVWLKMLGQSGQDTLIAPVNSQFAADVEGMGIYVIDGASYLVVSSQGNNRYGVFAVDDNDRFLGTFDIQVNVERHIDGVSETDGLAITHLPLTPQLKDGLLVVQDGRNVMPMAPQNFKLIDARHIKTFIQTHR